MANSNCAPVDVYDGWIPAHIFVHSAGLSGKRFVGLHQVQITDGPTGLFKGFAACIDRADTHDRRVQPSGCVAGDTGQRLKATLLSFLGGHQQDCRGAIIQARGIRCGDSSTFA